MSFMGIIKRYLGYQEEEEIPTNEEVPGPHYKAMLFMENKGLEYHWILAVGKDLNSMKQHFLNHFKQAEHHMDLPFQFQDEGKLTLQVEPQTTDSGWFIQPLKSPCTIYKSDVDQRDPEACPVFCKVRIAVTQLDNPPSTSLSLSIPLEGIIPLGQSLNMFFHPPLARRDSDYYQRHLQAAIKMVRKRGALTLRTYHVLMHGLPGAGKTCCKQRLTGQKLTGRKPAERRGEQLWYPDDSTCSTGVAENITRARVPTVVSARDPNQSTAIIHGVDDVPWLMLDSFDEEVVDIIKKMEEAMESFGQEEVKLPQRKIAATPDKTTTPVTSVTSATESAPRLATLETLEQMITTAFKNAKHEEIQNILQKKTLVYLIDSGGQPQFQELLPVLVSGPTLFLLTFSLLEGLQAEFKVRYTSPEGCRYEYPDPAKRKVLDVLIESLGSIKCTCSYQARGGEIVEVKPRVLFVGTMRDLVTDEELSTIDQELRVAIEDFMDLVVTNGAKVIFPVDSFADGDGGFADLRLACREASSEKVTKTVGGEALTEEVCEVTLPSTSVALELILRSRKKKLITLEECRALAAECGIEPAELPDVLWLLQHFIGSICHYAENHELREYIVNSPQVLYDAPTKLLVETFAFKKGDLHHVAKEKVWRRGVFTMATLRKLWNDKEFTPELLLSFLLHLNIVAPLQEKDTYFMPCALVCAPKDGPSDVRLGEDSALVCFEGGLTPKGVYSSLLAYLLNKKPQTESCHLEWILPTVPGSLSSNRAKLSVCAHHKYPFHVELAVHLKIIEVVVDAPAKGIFPSQRYQCCHAILRSVFDAVKEIVKHLHYNSNATPLEGLFFPCSCKQFGPHAVRYSEEQELGWCRGIPSYPAQVWIDKWITEESKDASSLAVATVVPTSQLHTSGGASRPTLRELQYMEYTDSSGEKRVLRLMDKIAACWDNVGIALNMETFLPQYRRDHQECRDQVRNMLTDWLEGRHQGGDSRRSVTWPDLLRALKESNEHETARELRDALANCTA